MIRILGFGDSLTAGSPGYDPEHGWGEPKSQYGYWIKKYAKRDGWENISFHNKGIPGELARWMPGRLSHHLQGSKYAYAIILGGSNDIGWQDTPTQIIEYLKALWLIAREKEIEVIACTVPPIADLYPSIQSTQLELNNLISENVTKIEGVHIADIYHALANSEGLLSYEYDSGDGLHLSVEGYKRMGEEIWKGTLISLLKEKF
jgi:lysophospholipase L1-like esterase